MNMGSKKEKKSRFSLSHYKKEFLGLVEETDKKTLALWAVDCVERVMPYFEDRYPDDPRPRKAIQVLQDWINTGEFSMQVIRGASLSSHAALGR